MKVAIKLTSFFTVILLANLEGGVGEPGVRSGFRHRNEGTQIESGSWQFEDDTAAPVPDFADISTERKRDARRSVQRDEYNPRPLLNHIISTSANYDENAEPEPLQLRNRADRPEGGILNGVFAETEGPERNRADRPEGGILNGVFAETEGSERTFGTRQRPLKNRVESDDTETFEEEISEDESIEQTLDAQSARPDPQDDSDRHRKTIRNRQDRFRIEGFGAGTARRDIQDELDSISSDF
eukprot:Selendium_serpulae@DN3307_c0_g1_i1.p1